MAASVVFRNAASCWNLFTLPTLSTLEWGIDFASTKKATKSDV